MRNHKQSDRVLNLPAGYFGIVLGTIGMGFAWRYASQIWAISHWPGDIMVILAMIIWGLLTLAFLSRLARFPHSVMAEVRHPVMSSFVSLFSRHHDAGRDRLRPLVSPVGRCAIQCGGLSYNWRTPPGRRRDFGAERIRKKQRPQGFICQR